MAKIYYNEKGWVCERYPYDLPITDDTRYIEVIDELANTTYTCPHHYAWRVVNGSLVIDLYEQIPQSEQAQMEIAELIAWLESIDYKTSKYVDGEYTNDEWVKIVEQRRSIRARIRELEQLL